MIEFKILKKSKKSRARLGILKTPHGEIETPALVTVATQASVKTLTSEEAERAGSQLLIANTFHLHLKPGEKIIKSSGGIHEFMNWQKPLMTDSGGFQVFSLGFGRDLGVGKILKYFSGEEKKDIVLKNRQPSSVKITDDGVKFRSPIDGKEFFLGPKESIKIQEQIGADIIFAFDECTPPLSNFEYAKKSLERTHKWAEVCLSNHKTRQALFGIIQGSHFKELREKGSKFINSLGFDGYGIGGDLGKSKSDMKTILDWIVPNLDAQRPRHLLGIGHLEDMIPNIKSGMDTFDCITPTHYARHGTAFTSSGRLDMRQKKFLNTSAGGKKPLDPKCGCEVCQNYTRSYISHLLRAKEITALRLLTFHNLYFFNNYVAEIREKIKAGKL
ncbi:MAG: tRNA guanosine(34) transglycosylase Tgt [Candidatus Pacebacteria bacterium]|nr:tRNA guanosine(34) transglycosylase Tgt [Candidatus Paceibacterota bacterium]